MKFKKILKIILILSLLIIASCKNNKTNLPEVTVSENDYVLKLIDNDLLLIYNNRIIKKYEINSDVLPSEDIKLLTDGINIQDESQADLIAENFDG